MPGNSALLHARGIYSSFAGSGSGKKSSTNRISSDEDVRVITAAGTGMVIEKRYDIAKKNAVYDALNNAIENILELMSAPELISQNYQLLENNIFSNTLEYIKKYEIIQTEMIKEDIYSVKIEAIIDTDKLERDLDVIGLLLYRLGKPSLFIIVNSDDSVKAVRDELSEVERILGEEFTKFGFDIVDVASSDIAPYRNRSLIVGDRHFSAVISLAGEYGADVAIIGSAEIIVANPTKKGRSRINSIRVTIKLNAIMTDNGVLITEATAHADYPHSNIKTGVRRAVRKAVTKVSGALMQDIINRWSTEVNAGRTINLTVNNIRGYAQFLSLKNSLRYLIRGFVNIRTMNYGGNIAELEVQARSTAEKIAQEIDGIIIDDMMIDVTDVSLNSLSISIDGK
ncbi:MAG: hypothetical protein IID12_03975 [Candidatus Marinimicrobia bacterium]|nr:hypothetical protein [Candidatus Neomarinimicrobiota bacterium]